MIAYASLFLWIVVILILGSGTGSMAQTSRFIKPLIEFFFPSAPPETFLFIHAIIRKAAHFVEYAILAVLAARAFVRSPSNRVDRSPIFALLTVAAVAVVDEVTQSFNITRTGSTWDVLIDLVGGITGLFLFAAIARFRGPRSGRK